MAGADLRSITASPHVKLVAVADVDLSRVTEVKKQFPDVKVYQDYRELLDKEKNLDSCNISTPDHMHAPITLAAMNRGLHVYTQKPLTQTIYEARELTLLAREKKIVSQMGIQIHSHPVHKSIVAIIHDGAIGKVKEVHSWSGKSWGDNNPRPKRTDEVPKGLDWNLWLGVAEKRPYIQGYYHPGNWRKRLDFGTGTFGDMGCHILDPVFTSMAFKIPLSVTSQGNGTNEDSWGIGSQVRYKFAKTPYTTDAPILTWYDGERRPPAEIVALIGKHQLSDQGSIYIGEKGVLFAPYIADPVLLPTDKFIDYKRPEVKGNDHYLQFVEAVRGNDKTSTSFDYAGPLTEAVLLGCLATRFPEKTLEWDATAVKVTNEAAANKFVRKTYRQGW
jgi:predicted dehydrogenase